MLWQIQATFQKKTRQGTITGQIPTFVLDDTVQFITTAQQAEFIAEEIINPTRDKHLKVHVYVYYSCTNLGKENMP